MVKQFFVAFLIVARTGAQEIPSDLEPILFMDAVHADLEAACPTGIDKCECMHAPGRCSQKVITLKGQNFNFT